MVLNAMPAKLLNLLITSLNTSFCTAKEHVAKSSEIGRKQPIEMTAEVQSNYASFKKNQLKKNFFRLKSQQKPAAVWQLPSQGSWLPKYDK